jgi:hypothetical protein
MDQDNLYATLKPVNYLCRIIGVASYSISDLKDDYSKLGKRFWKVLWPYILVILLICGYVHRIWFTFIVESQLVHHNIFVLHIVNTSVEHISCILIIIFRTFNHPKNMSLIFTKFDSINGYVLGHHDELNTKKGIGPLILGSFWLLVCIRMVLMCSNLVVWKPHWSPAVIFGGSWCRVALCVVIMKYVLLVQYYRTKHRVLNDQIRTLNDLTIPKFKVVLSKKINDLLTVGSRSNPRTNRTPESAADTTISDSDKLFLTCFKALQKYHMNLMM